MVGRNDPCWCGSGKKWKKCHFPQEAARTDIIIKSPEQIAKIKRACQLAVKILDATCEMAKKGVTTQQLNDFAHKMHLEAGAIPAPLGYGSPPFPKSICTSLNDVICHGIPDNRPLEDGDILNIDVTCILDGYFGDASRMVCIGKVDEEKEHVVNVAHECLMRAVKILGPNVPLNKIGDTIQTYAEKEGCSVVTQFVGHGVGIRFHEPPQVPHFRTNNSFLLVPGMTFTIEPMINAGSYEAVVDPSDHWTARTKDGKPSAQWEHTLLITQAGYEILTPWIRN